MIKNFINNNELTEKEILSNEAEEIIDKADTDWKRIKDRELDLFAGILDRVEDLRKQLETVADFYCEHLNIFAAMDSGSRRNLKVILEIAKDSTKMVKLLEQFES